MVVDAKQPPQNMAIIFLYNKTWKQEGEDSLQESFNPTLGWQLLT